MQHTKEPWLAIRGVEPDDIYRSGISVKRGSMDFLIATIENGAPGDSCETEFANAARIVACVNAMAGIKDPWQFVKSRTTPSSREAAAISLLSRLMKTHGTLCWGEGEFNQAERDMRDELTNVSKGQNNETS